ncbi:MAG: DegV family protein, partial [Kosmotogaceae bacterium]|nr:DegV family protein [Kosmotogaceae bacterium]
MIKIVTDSSCDLPIDTLKELEIPFASLNIFVENQTFKEDIDITPEEFWQSMSKSRELPKTSQPSPADFAGIFEKIQNNGDTPLCITISSKLSGTYQSAVLGAELTGNKAIVFDSLAGSISHGIQVLIAARMAKSGATVDEVLSALKAYRDNVEIIIPLATVENIVKGGRLSKFQGSLVNILNMKIILHGVNGEV